MIRGNLMSSGWLMTQCIYSLGQSILKNRLQHNYNLRLPKMDQQPQQPHHSTCSSEPQTLQTLSTLCQKLHSHNSTPDPLLRQYMSLYIESHHRSDEYFISLCEDRFFHAMFESAGKLQEPTCILECLNLLITNTRNGHQLVYFLSQNVLHQYLFGVGILKHDGEFIEYYIQLLKTILMKISESEQSKSLIRLFCNNKYPTFPLLTHTTILASDANELTRVTAQQCVLILVGMINEKKIYEFYLSELPMVIFVVRLATEYLRVDSDHQGICRYFADLMYEMRGNRVPLMVVSNVLCNVVIVSSLPTRVGVALSFIQLLTKSIQTRVLQHKGLLLSSSQKSNPYFNKKPQKSPQIPLSESSCQQLITICATLYRILIKYMTNKYLNASYLSAFIGLCPVSGRPQDNQVSLPLKVTYPGSQLLSKMMMDFNFRKFFQGEGCVSEIQFRIDFMVEIEAKINQYSVSKEFLKAKEVYLKKIGNSNAKNTQPSVSIFGRIFNRGTSDQLNTQYLKYVSDFSNLNFNKGQPVSENIAKQFNPAGSPFFSQYILLSTSLKNGLKYDRIKTGQQSDTVQPNQIHFNDVRSIWAFSQSNLEIIYMMTQRFVQFINVQSPQVATIVVPKIYVPPSYMFIGQFKDYLTYSIHEHINRQPKNAQLMSTISMLMNLSKICSLLSIQLHETPYLSLITQLTIIHQQLQNCLFQNGFHDVVEYIKSKNKAVLLEIERNRSKSGKIQDSLVKEKGDRKSAKVKVKPGLTFIKICSFQCIQKIMDPHIKPLLRYFQVKWRQTILKKSSAFSQFYQQTLSSFKVSYFGKNGCVLSLVKLMKPPTIVLRVELAGKKFLQIDITELEGIRKNSIDNRVLQFGGGNVQNVKTETIEMSTQIIESFNKCKFSYEQCITNATLQYLSSTNETLNIKSKQMGRQSVRMSQCFQTPQ